MPEFLNGAGPMRSAPLAPALYRAGRFEEAIRRLDEGIGGQDGQGLPQNWAFLAMAHAVSGIGRGPSVARPVSHLRSPWKADRAIPSFSCFAGRGSYWNDLEIRLLRREAESLILDPAFPADPFAP